MSRKIIRTGSIGILVLLAGCSVPFAQSQESQDTMQSPHRHIARDYAPLQSINELIALFPTSVEEIDKQKAFAIAGVEEGIAQLLAIPDTERTFDNTARAYDRILANYSFVTVPIYALKMLSPEDDLRTHAQKVLAELQSFSVDAFYNVDIYQAMRAYHAQGAEQEKLTAEERYFIDETVSDLARMGLGLPALQLAKVKELKKKLAQLSLEFSANIAKDKSSITVKHVGLAGLSDTFIANLKQEKDLYVLTVDYPTYLETMEHCSVGITRRDLYRAFHQRAYPQNKKILEKIIALRDELAILLNFPSYAHLDLDDVMIEHPTKAYSFLHDLLGRVAKKADQEFAQFVQELPAGVTLTQDGKLEPWDVSFVKGHYKKKHYDIDERSISEFFELERTIAGLFDIYQQFFDLTFKHQKPNGLWHEDVSLIDVYDNATNKRIGSVLIDLHPRPNKYSHACHVGLVSAIEYMSLDGKGFVQRPSAAIVVANFPKKTTERPSLLKHSDVVTFFHEFGHALHAILGKTNLAAFSGTSVKTDFVELPSQMLENWMWQKEILRQLSAHYKTGEPLPEALIEKMVALKKYDSGSFVQRQCALSLVSLDYFASGRYKDTDAILRDIFQTHAPQSRFDEHNHMQASFGHLTGYGAKYYSYMLSRVWAQDVFAQVQKEGLLSPGAGRRLITEILGKGGSVDPNELLRNYLGREPKIEPFLEDLGLDGD